MRILAFRLPIVAFLVTVFSIFLLVSCGEGNVPSEKSPYEVGSFNTELKVIQIEGCEYFFTDYRRSAIMCHKGNCSNPIHKIQ